MTAIRRLIAAWLVRRIVLRIDPGHPVVVQDADGLDVRVGDVSLARIAPGTVNDRRYGPEHP